MNWMNWMIAFLVLQYKLNPFSSKELLTIYNVCILYWPLVAIAMRWEIGVCLGIGFKVQTVATRWNAGSKADMCLVGLHTYMCVYVLFCL